MPGQHYTAEQRNFLSMRYQELSGARNFIPIIIAELTDRFPDAQVPNRRTILKQNQKQNTHLTLKSLRDTFFGTPFRIEIAFVFYFILSYFLVVFLQIIQL